MLPDRASNPGLLDSSQTRFRPRYAARQNYFDDITLYLIFVSVGGLRATMSTDSSMESVFASAMENDVSTKSGSSSKCLRIYVINRHVNKDVHCSFDKDN